MALADLLAGAGAGQGLQDLLTRRLYEQQLAEQIRANRAKEELEGRGLTEASDLRRAQQEETQRMRREAEFDRDQTIALRQAESIPAGTELGTRSPEAQTLIRGGQGSILTKLGSNLASTSTIGGMGLPGPKPIKATSIQSIEPARPERYRKEATATQSEREADNARAVISLLNLQSQRDTTNELAKQRLDLHKQFGYYHPVQFMGPNGEYLNGLVRPNAAPAGTQAGAPPAGTSGLTFQSQPTPAAKGKISDAGNVVSQINQIQQFGDQMGWQGVGVLTGPLQGVRKRVTGGGSDAGDQLRVALDSLKADIAHEKYGAAFTSTERQMLSSFAPGSNMSAEAVKNRLQIMKQIIGNRVQYLQGGGSLETAPPVTDFLAPSRTGQTGAATGVPEVGSTFQGGRVTSVRKIR